VNSRGETTKAPGNTTTPAVLDALAVIKETWIYCLSVIPAQAGIHFNQPFKWIPAFAGMTFPE